LNLIPGTGPVTYSVFLTNYDTVTGSPIGFPENISIPNASGANQPTYLEISFNRVIREGDMSPSNLDMLVIVTPVGTPYNYQLTRLDSYFPIQITLSYSSIQPSATVELLLGTVGVHTEESA